jgi:hypothetical protein
MAARTRSQTCTSALRVAQRVFLLSTAEPTSLVLYREDIGAGGGELPDGRLLLRPLRDLLLHPQTPPATRDAVWRVLIRRARADRSAWLVAALGMAMPGLRREVRSLSVNFRGDRDDLESAVAEGFVAELYRVDLAATALCARLVRAGRRAGLRQVYQDAAPQRVAWSDFASHPPRVPWGHPDLVLLDAVRSGVLSPQEAWLIGVTRLEAVPIDAVARRTGQRPRTVAARRHRAERRLREAIVAGDVACGSGLSTGYRPPTGAAVGRCEPVSAAGPPIRSSHGRLSPGTGSPPPGSRTARGVAGATSPGRRPAGATLTTYRGAACCAAPPEVES